MTEKKINRTGIFATIFNCACFILLAVILLLNPFYPFPSNNIATVIAILALLLVIWNGFSRRLTKVRVQLTCLLVFLLILDVNTGYITRALIAIVEMKSPYAYLPFTVIRTPLAILDQIALPSILKYLAEIVVLATFWGFIGLLFYKVIKENKNFQQKRVGSSRHQKNAGNIWLSEWKALLLIVCVSFITRLLASVYYNPIPIGNDIWGNFNVLQGYYGYSYMEGTLQVYHSLLWNNAPLYAVGFRPFYYFFLYNLGQLWQIPSDSIIFIEAIPILFNVLLSISIYGLSLKITHNNKASLVAGLISALSVGQLLMLRINIQETLGLLLMLCALYTYLLLIDGRQDKNLGPFLLFFVMLNLVQFTHEQPFVILLTIIFVHQTFCFLLQGWTQQVNTDKKGFLTYLKQYFKKHSKGLYAIFAVIFSLTIRYGYAFFFRRGQITSLISSTSQHEVTSLPYSTLANMYGIPIVIFSFFGVMLGLKSLKRGNKTFLIAFLFAALIYIFQAPLGITINPDPARIPEELYVPFVILAALGVDGLILELANTRVQIAFNLKWIRRKSIGLNINFLKYFLLFLVFFSSCFIYITNSSNIPRKYMPYPTETLYSQPEYEAALWLKSNVNPERTIVIADSLYYAMIYSLSEFKVIRFHPYFLRPFSNYDEEPIIALNRIIEYLLSKNYIVIVAQRKVDTLSSFTIPFEKIFENDDVKFYMIKPNYQEFNLTSPPLHEHIVFNFDANEGNDSIQVYGARSFYDSSLNRYAVRFDGNDYVSVAHNDVLNAPSDFTIEVLIKTSTTTSGVVISKYSANVGWHLEVYSDGRVLAWFYASATDYTTNLYSTKKVNDGVWHHIVVARTYGDKYRMYIDGILDKEYADNTAGPVSSTEKVYIGTRPGLTQHFNGSIALVRIFNKALNKMDVERLYFSLKDKIHVTHDGSYEDLPLSLKGYGPLATTAQLKLKGYINYSLSNIPEFLNFKTVFPLPLSIEIGINEIRITAQNKEEECTVTFEGPMSYFNVGWKDEVFLTGWLRWENETGAYTINGTMLKMSKDFVLGSVDKFTLEKQIIIDGTRYPYLLIKASGEFSLTTLSSEAPELSVLLHVATGQWIEVIRVWPTSYWDLYIVKIPPLHYDRIALQINDEDWDLDGYHECSLDYILFADWSPSQFWAQYYVEE